MAKPRSWVGVVLKSRRMKWISGFELTSVSACGQTSTALITRQPIPRLSPVVCSRVDVLQCCVCIVVSNMLSYHMSLRSYDIHFMRLDFKTTPTHDRGFAIQTMTTKFFWYFT
jgi:hypothetical protein